MLRVRDKARFQLDKPHRAGGPGPVSDKPSDKCSDATIAGALATFEKMPAAGQAWLQNSLSRLDTSTAAWVVGRMASIHRANSD